MFIILLSIFLGVGSIALLALIPQYSFRFPDGVRVHLWTAAIWTVITLFQTASLLLWSDTPNLIGYVVAVIAGWTMISSWRQLIERREGHMAAQSRRSLPQRLFVQTLWGPLAVWFVAVTTPFLADRLVWRAITHRDIVTIHLLKSCGFSATSNHLSQELGLGTPDDYSRLRTGLETVVERHDTLGVLTYLEAGGEEFYTFYKDNDDDEQWALYAPLVLAVERDNTVITDLLLRNGADPLVGNDSTPLLIAVRSGNIRQVQTMLQYVDFSRAERHGADLLTAARNRYNQPMFDLLWKAGARIETASSERHRVTDQ